MYHQIDVIEIELSNLCNAWCPACVRYVQQDDGLYINKNIYKQSRILDKDLILKAITDPKVNYADRLELRLCGVASDPFTHPELLTILSDIKSARPNTRILIHTNGSLKNQNTYIELAKILDRRDTVQFNIDGLEDTNHIYRRKTNYQRIMQNAQALIDNNANRIKVDWAYIVFPWNNHQIDLATELSKSMGFNKIFFRKSRQPVEDDMDMIAIADRGLKNGKYEDNVVYSDQMEIPNYDSIEDECFSRNLLFLNETGKVYPCCNWSSVLNYEEGYHKQELESYLSQFPENDLNKNSMYEILQNPLWDSLKKRIDSQNDALVSCVKQCGLCETKNPKSWEVLY